MYLVTSFDKSKCRKNEGLISSVLTLIGYISALHSPSTGEIAALRQVRANLTVDYISDTNFVFSTIGALRICGLKVRYFSAA